MPVFRDKFEISQELLDDLRSRFLEEINSGPEASAKYHPDDLEQVKQNDWYLARYLLHEDCNVDNALKGLKKSLEFRNEMEVNTLKKEDLKKEHFDLRVLQLYNHDNDNYPILALRFKAHKKNVDEVRLQQQYFLYWVEKVVRMNDWGGLTVLFDCTDAGYSNVDLELLKFVLNTFQLYYPWTLHIFLVYNLPWYLTAIWKLVKTWIAEKHLKRVAFADKEAILEYIDKDQLPVCLGGTCTDQYESEEVEEPAKGWF